jgi:DNA polymerase III alpha subunit (gram-positive type)
MTIERKQFKSILDQQHEIRNVSELLTERITEYTELTNFHLQNQKKEELIIPDLSKFTELEMLLHLERCVIKYTQVIGDSK